MVSVTNLPLSCFVLRRRFPWNIILLSIFVSRLGLAGGPGGAPMAPQLPLGVLGGTGGHVGR